MSDNAVLQAEPSAELRDLFRMVDAADVDGYMKRYSDDTVVRFGSAPPVEGREAVAAAVAAVHARFEMSHTFVNVWEAGGTAVCEFEVEYTVRSNGRRLTLPAVAIIHRGADGLIDDMRSFSDQGPLQEAAAAG